MSRSGKDVSMRFWTAWIQQGPAYSDTRGGGWRGGQDTIHQTLSGQKADQDTGSEVLRLVEGFGLQIFEESQILLDVVRNRQLSFLIW
jgi:hypothetical protein